VRRLALCLLVLSAATPAPILSQFSDERTGLVISPPDWFYRQGEDLLAAPSLISCWEAPAEEDAPWIRMCAEIAEALPKTGERMTFHWKERSVQGLRVETRRGSEPVVMYSALLPMHLQKVRLDVVAPVRAAEDAKAVLEETLATVVDRGPWIVRADGTMPEGEREPAYSDRSDRRAARLIGKIGTGLLIAGILAFLRDRRARKQAAEGGATA
jgi:hypothetical protein